MVLTEYAGHVEYVQGAYRLAGETSSYPVDGILCKPEVEIHQKQGMAINRITPNPYQTGDVVLVHAELILIVILSLECYIVICIEWLYVYFTALCFSHVEVRFDISVIKELIERIDWLMLLMCLLFRSRVAEFALTPWCLGFNWNWISRKHWICPSTRNSRRSEAK